MDITPDVTIATATHIVCKDDLSKVNEELNSQLQKKNSIAIKVAEKYHLNVNDLYKYMIEEGYMYKHTDMVHFEQSSNEFIAKRVAKAIGLDWVLKILGVRHTQNLIKKIKK